ncbi:GNAT family N-acetyltransferase [Brevibacillus sp. SIMBA_076]
MNNESHEVIGMSVVQNGNTLIRPVRLEDAAAIWELEREIVGVIGFSSPNRKRLAHTGSIMMMISKDFRSKGLGKVLLQELLAWAEQHPLIEKVSLGVLSTNHRAIALYKRMGFVEEGRKVKEFKVSENEYIDDVLMYRFV